MRLTPAQSLAAAGAVTWPDFEEGEMVAVLYEISDPILGIVTEAPDRNGWLKVTDGDLVFIALAAATVRL